MWVETAFIRIARAGNRGTADSSAVDHATGRPTAANVADVASHPLAASSPLSRPLRAGLTVVARSTAASSPVCGASAPRNVLVMTSSVFRPYTAPVAPVLAVGPAPGAATAHRENHVRGSRPLRWDRLGVDAPISPERTGENGSVYDGSRRQILYYLRARYYDPSTAQFLTLDPAIAATRSPYAYVAGNPLNATDPTGKGLSDFIDILIHAFEPALCPPSDELGSSGQPPECFPAGSTPTSKPTLDSHKGTATCNAQDDCWYTFPGGPAPRTIYVPGHKILVTDLFGNPLDANMSPLYGPPRVQTWIQGRTGGANWVDPAHDPANSQAFVWTPCAGGPDTQDGRSW